jgi:hypothetical protein
MEYTRERVTVGEKWVKAISINLADAKRLAAEADVAESLDFAGGYVSLSYVLCDDAWKMLDHLQEAGYRNWTRDSTWATTAVCALDFPENDQLLMRKLLAITRSEFRKLAPDLANLISNTSSRQDDDIVAVQVFKEEGMGFGFDEKVDFSKWPEGLAMWQNTKPLPHVRQWGLEYAAANEKLTDMTEFERMVGEVVDIKSIVVPGSQISPEKQACLKAHNIEWKADE